MKKQSKSKKQASPAAEREPRDEHEEPSKLTFEGVLAREEAASYFEALISGLRKGQVRFRRANESLTLSPTSQVAVEVKAGRKSGKEKLSFEMSWTTVSDHDLHID